MNVVIRQSAFETNSSSTHSLTLGSKTAIDEQENVVKVFKGGHFPSYQSQEVVSFEDKVGYLITGLGNLEEYQHIFGINDDSVDVMFEKLKTTLIKFMGYKDVVFEKYDEMHGAFGALDEETLQEIMSSQENLESFLFSRDSFIRIS